MSHYKHDYDMIPNRTWDDSLISGTEHIHDLMYRVYNILHNNDHIRLLISEYPHACVMSSIWQLMEMVGLQVFYKKERYVLESLRFTHIDLLKLEFKDHARHASEYIATMKSLLNSTFYTLDDIQFLTNRSGIRNINLCGMMDGNDIVHHSNWTTERGYSIPEEYDATVFWRLYPYSDSVHVPQMKDFEIGFHDIHVLFLPKRINWLNILIYTKTIDNPRLNIALEEYRSVLTNAVRSNKLPDFKREHSKLLRYGLRIWMCDYDTFYDVLHEITPSAHQPMDTLDIELEDSYMDGYVDDEIDVTDHASSAANTTKDDDSDNNYEDYMNSFYNNDYFKEYITSLKAVFPQYMKFLNSNRFKNAYKERYGDEFVNIFTKEHNGIFMATTPP